MSQVTYVHLCDDTEDLVSLFAKRNSKPSVAVSQAMILPETFELLLLDNNVPFLDGVPGDNAGRHVRIFLHKQFC